MAATLACGAGSAISHLSAAALWGFGEKRNEIEVSVPRDCRIDGIRTHVRRGLTARELTRRDGIPVTTPSRTLIDLAAREEPDATLAMVGEADRLNVIRWDALQAVVAAAAPGPGVGRLRRLMAEFSLTQSELERLFPLIARRAGLSDPLSQRSSTASWSTSTGPSSGSWSRRTAFDTTAHRPARRAT